MSRYVQFARTGAPDVLTICREAIPVATGSNVVVRNEAIGFNFIDTYFRRGIYPVPLPSRSGSEGAGTVHSVGPDVDPRLQIKVGDRVCYLSRSTYADYAVAPAARVAHLPDGISFEVAAGSLLKGLTAQYLLQIYRPARDEVVLFHAGAGGVGSIFLQWAASLGARVVATAGSEEKQKLALKLGAARAVGYEDDLAAAVADLNGGRKVKVVYDSVGESTFTSSLDALAPRGMLISYGNASGQVPPFSLTELQKRGSLFVTRPVLADYIEDFNAQANEFFELVLRGVIKIDITQRYDLEHVRQLHEDAEARRLTGSTVILT